MVLMNSGAALACAGLAVDMGDGIEISREMSASGAAGDLSGDGVPDIITNEMLGDGSSAEAEDVGNLLIIDSKVLFRGQTIHADGFESP